MGIAGLGHRRIWMQTLAGLSFVYRRLKLGHVSGRSGREFTLQATGRHGPWLVTRAGEHASAMSPVMCEHTQVVSHLPCVVCSRVQECLISYFILDLAVLDLSSHNSASLRWQGLAFALSPVMPEHASCSDLLPPKSALFFVFFWSFQ